MSEIVSRRGFVASTVAAGLSAALARGASANRKPNFVVILSDDHGRLYTGCYGAKGLRTPNIDRLASQGMVFSHAFTATAMCAPSRSMLYTALFPHRNGAHPNHSAVRRGTRSLPHYLKPLGYRVALAGKTHIKPRECFPFEYVSLRGVERFLRSVRGEPFCLVIATHYPHAPWLKTGPYDAAEVTLRPDLLDTPETRQAMARYWNTVDALDRQVGQFLALLKRFGLEENTLCIYTSDHGAQFPFSKWTLYDAGIRVPFIVRWPGRVRPGTQTDAMVSFVDVLPTLVEAAGGVPPAGLDGRSFLAVLEGRKSDHRDIIYATHTTKGIISGSYYPIRAVRTRTHKYIVNLNAGGKFTNVVTEGRKGGKGAGGPADYWLSWLELARRDPEAAARVRHYQHRPPEELYDLRSDPFELKNLANDPAQRRLMDKLRAELRAWMKQQGDPLLAKLS